MTEDFGHMVDLILALHRHGVPLRALDLGFFTEWERYKIEAAYQFSLGELETSVREKPVANTRVLTADEITLIVLSLGRTADASAHTDAAVQIWRLAADISTAGSIVLTEKTP